MKLKRFEGNPILSPNPANPWESIVTANPGAWYDEGAGQVLMLYRAAGADAEHRIHFGLATSRDGYHFRRASDQPVFSPSLNGFDAGCVEDPRVVKMGDWYYVTYAARPFPPGEYWLQGDAKRYHAPTCPPEFPWMLRTNATWTGLALTCDFRQWIRLGPITHGLDDDRDVILFPERIGGKFAMLHRPANLVGQEYGLDNPAMWISFSDDLLTWDRGQVLAKGEYDWEGGKIGGNTPPIRTPQGWLTLYHAVGADKHYRLGALLLDLDDPATVRYRTHDWLLQPEEWYELEGHYPGVCFPCGKVVIGDTLFVYYGGADKYVGLATCSLPELLAYLLSCPTRSGTY
jgi:predicted GH43/DUF377 family glycosyl hydrolase